MNDFVRIATGQTTIANTRAKHDKVAKAKPAHKREARRSPRARVNFIPSQEQLQKLIDDALTALSRGIYWDRGAIVDIVL